MSLSLLVCNTVPFSAKVHEQKKNQENENDGKKGHLTSERGGAIGEIAFSPFLIA